MKNVVGPKIQKLRQSQNPRITQADLAARLQALGLEIDQTALSRIEHGERQVTDIEIIAISQALDTGVAELFENAKLPEPTNPPEPDAETV